MADDPRAVVLAFHAQLGKREATAFCLGASADQPELTGDKWADDRL